MIDPRTETATPRDARRNLQRARDRHEPICQLIERRRFEQWWITGAVWQNGSGYGCGSNETLIRDLKAGNGPDATVMCNHYELDIPTALDEIEWRLRAGWCPWETARAVEALSEEIEEARFA